MYCMYIFKYVIKKKKKKISEKWLKKVKEISKQSECACVCLCDRFVFLSFLPPFHILSSNSTFSVQNDGKCCAVYFIVRECVYYIFFFVHGFAWSLIWMICVSFWVILMCVYLCIFAPHEKERAQQNHSARNNIIPEYHTLKNRHAHTQAQAQTIRSCRRACEMIMMITGQMISVFV